MGIEDLVGKDEWVGANQLGRPYVVYKFAATLDGRIAAADGTSQWITSEVSRHEVHLLRSGCHATLVGSGTQRADNPNLAVRGEAAKLVERQPWRVIVDSNAKTPKDALVLNEAAPTMIAVAEDADAGHLEGKATVVRVKRSAPGLDIEALLQILFARGIQSVFLEGGPTLAGSFMGAGLIDRVISYIAPAFLGSGKSGLVDAGIGTMADILRLEVVDLDRSGPDVRIISRPLRRRGP